MKVLDVNPFHEGLQRNIQMLSRIEEEMKAIQLAVDGLVAMEDSFKGEGAQAIRSFYDNCHLPLLHFFMTFKNEFDGILKQMDAALSSLESNTNGFIRQSFLQEDVEDGLTEISEITGNLTGETNAIMDQVSDIVALPHLDDSGVQDGVINSRKKRDDTVTALEEFDSTQTNALGVIEAALLHIETWISDMELLIEEGLTDVDFPSENWNLLQENTPIGKFYAQHQLDLLKENPRVNENDVEVSSPIYTVEDLWEGILSTVGMNINGWEDKPINAAASLGVFAYSGYVAGKEGRLAAQGFGIKREERITAKGERRVVLKLTKPELIGVKKKTYSGKNATNYTKIFKRVDAATNVKESLKFAGNKIGYAGVIATVGGDIVHGIQHKESGSKIAGDVTGDVAVAGASIAASAWAGAQTGALMGSFGGPVGVAAGAVAGLVTGIVVTTVLSEIDIMDVDNDGQKDSIGDAIKIGTKGVIDKVSSWFS
ncbi:ribonuclease YeeF family protein [Psychrobacillus lasiicapitis]|uniref:LXG domain-containing protein n=1 Tax=Psychrobacillus lasiicapitis TaxID=1636719 RepID=A0A544T2T6_9BACI|nr:LXG domain-containing protein [Psychrobacillus lasiicapitis]TQR11757.1 hypothetical protein FG382_14160 [Psychrobacillus lasiicapitis]GGA19223.1 hypothetical protein GCM10011384_05630 [Psychrobacillus lasiicapitis]